MARRAFVILRTIKAKRPMVFAPHGVCFYCDRPMVQSPQIDGERRPENSATTDHIFPQMRAGEVHFDVNVKMNKVTCCEACNSYKGALRPLDWLVIMPSDAGAMRLSQRLVEMGADEGAIISAMRRRA